MAPQLLRKKQQANTATSSAQKPAIRAALLVRSSLFLSLLPPSPLPRLSLSLAPSVCVPSACVFSWCTHTHCRPTHSHCVPTHPPIHARARRQTYTHTHTRTHEHTKTPTRAHTGTSTTGSACRHSGPPCRALLPRRVLSGAGGERVRPVQTKRLRVICRR